MLFFFFLLVFLTLASKLKQLKNKKKIILANIHMGKRDVIHMDCKMLINILLIIKLTLLNIS
jgi:hypothetical protein